MPYLSIVIPVYNSAATVTTVVDDCYAALSHIDFELVLVNDGSSDSSEEVIFDLAEKHPNIKAISLVKNVGEFNAVICGLNYASGEYTAIIDDDGQNPPAEILKLLQKAEGGYDVVYAKYEKKMHAKVRNLGSLLNDFFAWIFIGKPFSLYLSSFKVMHKQLVKQVIQYKGANAYPDVLILKSTKNIGVAIAGHQSSAIKSRYTFKKLVNVFSSMLITRYGFMGHVIFYLLILIGLLAILILSNNVFAVFTGEIGLGNQTYTTWLTFSLAALIIYILPKTQTDKQYKIKKSSF